MSEELLHYGVMGMKWGIRKDGKPQGYQGSKSSSRRSDSKYSNAQRAYDRKIYGRGAEKRIAKRIDKGENIKSARHNEVVRKDRKEKTKRVAKRALKATLQVLGAGAVTAGALWAANYVAKNPNLNIDPRVANMGAEIAARFAMLWANPF